MLKAADHRGKVSISILALALLVAFVCPAFAEINPKGKPEFGRHKGVGYAIWVDKDGWHIRWRGGSKRHRFQGYIKSSNDGVFHHAKPIRMEEGKGDWAVISNDRIDFDTDSGESNDGIDFKTNASSITFDIKVDDSHDKEKVFIGKGEATPDSIPFTLYTKH